MRVMWTKSDRDHIFLRIENSTPKVKIFSELYHHDWMWNNVLTHFGIEPLHDYLLVFSLTLLYNCKIRKIFKAEASVFVMINFFIVTPCNLIFSEGSCLLYARIPTATFYFHVPEMSISVQNALFSTKYSALATNADCNCWEKQHIMHLSSCPPIHLWNYHVDISLKSVCLCGGGYLNPVLHQQSRSPAVCHEMEEKR